jgi:hypothetical protein
MPLEYALNVDFRSGEVRHVLEKDRLVLSYAKDGRTDSIPLASIREINVRMDMGIPHTYVKRDGGRTLLIPARHFRALGIFDDRFAEYSAFVRALLEATSETGSTTRFTAGSSILFVLGVVLVALGVVFTVLVAVASIARGLPPLRLLLFLPFALISGGGLARSGRARAIDPRRPPRDLLPA